MDLIFWRHAEAHDESADDTDLARELTPRGLKQASRVASWLDRQLPDGARVFCSPARRTLQTADALGRKYKVRPEIAPDATAQALLDLVQWPHGKGVVVVVGHQPTLGQAVAQLLQAQVAEMPIRKGAVWWLRTREREGLRQTVVVAVQAPETV